MKILYVITRSDVMGGASVHLLDLAEGISNLGHEILILVGGEGVFWDLAKNRGLRVQSLKYLVREISPLRDILAVKEIFYKIKEFSPDIVHLHSSKAGVAGRIAARLQRRPAVFTAHGWAFTDGVSRNKQRVYRVIEKYLARITHKIISVSNYDRDLALRQKVGTKESLVTIHNGVRDVELPCVKQASPQIKFVMVARFDEPKNQALVLRSLALIKENDWTMEFVGDGPSQGHCRELATQLSLGGRVFFSGYCNDVDRRIAASDVLILASKWEGLPLTIIEAMRAGLPVIASNVGGIPELVIDGVTGLLAERENEVALGACLKSILESPDRRAAMGKAARDRYEKYFSFDTMRDRTMALYQSVHQQAYR